MMRGLVPNALTFNAAFALGMQDQIGTLEEASTA